MNTDEERTQKTHVVVDTPTEHREVVTQRSESVPEPSGPSTGTIALIAVVIITLISIIIYLVSNKNAERDADRNANLTAASMNDTQQQQPTIIQQPAAQPAPQTPVIIQQAPTQQQPAVIIQQPAPQPNADSSNADASMQEAATQKLSQNDGMALVTIRVSRGTATLGGNASSVALKSQAERVVRAVRGITAVDNQIVVAGI